MKFFVPIIFLFAFLGTWMTIGYGESFLDHLIKNASCPQWHSCGENKSVKGGLVLPFSCSCDSQCWQYGMCCRDAPHRDNGPPIYECGKTGHDRIGYFMVQKCSENTDIDSTWKSKCEEEWNGVYDISVLSPVTSLDTNKTYKNYYCFRCHEATDNIMLWNPSLIGISESSDESDTGYRFRVTYSEVIRTSVVAKDEKPFSNEIFLIFTPPMEIGLLAIQCKIDLVSNCPKNWMAKDVLDKCRAYVDIVMCKHSFRYFKNVYCASCNHVPLDEIKCPIYLGILVSNYYPPALSIPFQSNIENTTPPPVNCTKNQFQIKNECFNIFDKSQSLELH